MPSPLDLGGTDLGHADPGRIVLLDCSARVAPGCLTADAWDALRAAEVVLTGTCEHPQLPALAHAGVAVDQRDASDAVRLADTLVTAARSGLVVWLLAPDGDQGLTSALATRLVTGDAAVEVEHLLGSYDLPGSRLLDAVSVMDRLRSPGGCPWDAEQTHTSLMRYLIEEAYEVVEAVETGDREHLAEELGDLLMQVLFHSRIATEHAEVPFTIDDVADGVVAKLVRRHPHVFADAEAPTPAHVEANWEQIKAAEKGRTSILDGIPPGLPALSYAEKVLVRADRTGLALTASAPASTLQPDSVAPASTLNPCPSGPAGMDSAEVDSQRADLAGVDSAEALGAALLQLVVAAHRHGLDPEAALRRAARQLVPAEHLPTS